MSEWPEKYAFDVPGLRDVDFVKREDFERLLTFTVKFISPYNPGPLPLDVLRENILLQLKKEAEND